MDKSYKVGLYTLGCKVSLYETEAIAERFAERGFQICSFEDVCDVYIINTCTVTAESDAKSRKYIRRAVRKNPDAAVIVLGCYSQRAAEEVMAIEGVGAVLGTRDKLSSVDIAISLLKGEREKPLCFVGTLEGAPFEPMTVRKPDRTRAFVKIEDGCECRCTYCAIADARGPVRSKSVEEVVSEVGYLAREGTREIVLTGIETGSYGVDLGIKDGLFRLIRELAERTSVERIRLGSMAPELIGKDFAERVMSHPIMVPHLHVSMQSASNSVLRAMRRRYTSERALENIRRIKEIRPDTLFTADLMVGFPGESEEDFKKTFDFVSVAQLLDAHVFAYSKRSGTIAAELHGQVNEEVKKDRSARLIAEAGRVRDEILARLVEEKRPLCCIAESNKNGVYTAHSDSYVEVRFKCSEDISGRTISVIPLGYEKGYIYGKPII